MTGLAYSVDVDHLIAVGSSLSERLAAGYESQQRTAAGEGRFATWLEQAGLGDKDKLRRRLAWDGLDEPSAKALLSSTPNRLNGAQPFWAATLRSLVQFLEGHPSGPAKAVTEYGVNVPFADILEPFVVFGMMEVELSARSMVRSHVGDSLRRDLLLRVFDVASLTLGEEFMRTRKDAGVLESLIGGPANPTQTERYRSFAEHLRTGGWLEMFSKYPVLARLIAVSVQHWREDMSEFLNAFAVDEHELTARFFGGVNPGPLTTIAGTVSDPHHGGRSVKILTFETGRKLVYKPRNLAVDEAWRELLAWLRQRDGAINLRAPAVWPRHSYGWAEFVEHGPCQTRDGVCRFYLRAGMLTCLLYAVQGTDFHHENLIAAGEHVIPIDLETLFAHLPQEQDVTSVTDYRLLRSVLRSGLLPKWEQLGRATFDMSGLGTFSEGQVGGRAVEWKYPGTDHMHLAPLTGALPIEQNMPTLDGAPIAPDEFIQEIEDGFRLAYRTLLKHREELLAPRGPLNVFRGATVRVVLRATQIYARLLQRSVIPRLLRDGLDRSLELESMCRHVLSTHERHGCRKFFYAELTALEQLDIPYFEAATSSTEVLVGCGQVSHSLLAECSFDSAVAQISVLSPTDCDFQLELIRGSFAARAMRPPDRATRVEGTMRPHVRGQVLQSGQFIAEARFLAGELRKRIITDPQGRVNWIGLEPITGAERYQIRPLGSSLYAGLGGVAIFLAALYAVTSDSETKALAAAGARTLRDRMLPPGIDGRIVRSTALSEGIGGGSGLGGVLYSLTMLSRLLGDTRLIKDALQLSKFIDADVISGDRELDVMGGTAGLLLGLLALWSASGDNEALNAAILCGNHLVQRQEAVGELGAWSTGYSRPLTGFAHGAAGIAYSLLKLYAIHPDPAYRNAGVRAIAYENSTYSPKDQNWPDFREWYEGQSLRFRSGWCHGAPGIGLARLGSVGTEDSARIREDAAVALASVQSFSSYPIDTVCCGEFGMTELLLTAERLGCSEWRHAARDRASMVIGAAKARRGAESTHGYLLGACTKEGLFSVGFFQGLSGIGYSLLRLADPERLPCVLLWD
jgi:type 2 lantibiotic biosynthesis protein LanM